MQVVKVTKDLHRSGPATMRQALEEAEALVKLIKSLAVKRGFAEYKLGTPRTFFPHSKDFVIDTFGETVWLKYAKQSAPAKSFSWKNTVYITVDPIAYGNRD